MTRFALTVIRHGETRLNKEKIIQGQGIDEPLSETGFKQAAAVGLYLKNVKFTHAFSSDLTRTKQTMHGILENSKFCSKMTVKYDSRLRERKYGAAEGKALTELRALAKVAGLECPTFTPPGGETLDQVCSTSTRCRIHRLASVIEELRSGENAWKRLFEYLSQLILKEASQKEEFSQGVPGNSLETSLAEIFPLAKNLGSKFNSNSSTPGLAASVLVVSHGAYMRSLFDYFLTDLKCSLPATVSKSEIVSVSPNTGISLFIINLEEGKEVKPAIQCICMNLKEHLNGVTEAHQV